MPWNSLGYDALSGRVSASNLGSFGAEAQEMKGGVGVFPGVFVVLPSGGAELRLSLLSELPSIIGTSAGGVSWGFVLLLLKWNVDQELWVYRMCWERISSASVCASQGLIECSNESR